MFISKFCRLGVRAMRSPALRALPFSSAVSYFMVHNQHLRTELEAKDIPSLSINREFKRHLSFCSTAARVDSEEGDVEPKRINVTFIDKDGEEKHVKVPVGFSMLEAALDNDIDLEGACEGSMACSTCHVIVMDGDYYDKLPDPTDEELDMLDLALDLTKTSRLGCQIVATPELDGLRLALPSGTQNCMI